MAEDKKPDAVWEHVSHSGGDGNRWSITVGRLKVPNGWLYRTYILCNGYPAVSTTFVPERNA